MKTGETLMVVSTFKSVTVGQEFETIPDHMTWISWFNLPDNRQEDFALTLQNVVEENRPPRPVVGSSETFGDASLGYETVRRFDRMSEGFNLIQDFYAHAALYAFAASVDPHFDTTYLGLNWNPHTNKAAAGGQEFPLDNLVVFRKNVERHRKIVRDVYLWGRSQA